MESNLESETHSETLFNYRIGIPLIIGLVVLAYLFFTLDTVAAKNKTVSLTVNGLTTNHLVTYQTVGEFLDALYPNQDEVISVFPDRNQNITSGDTIFIKARPATINPTVALNLEKAATAAAVQETTIQAATTNNVPPEPVQPKSPVYNGAATWYKFGNKPTTASTQFPRGTKLRVIAINSGRQVDVVVNDYGPEAWTGVMLDLNSVAFARLAPLGAGKIPIRYYVI